MVSNQVMASKSIAELLKDNTSILDFIEDSIKLLLSSERPFLICSKEGIPPILFKKDEDGIWIAFLSELQGI